MEHIER